MLTRSWNYLSRSRFLLLSYTIPVYLMRNYAHINRTQMLTVSCAYVWLCINAVHSVRTI